MVEAASERVVIITNERNVGELMRLRRETAESRPIVGR
jgi:hypothetical protein